MDITEATKERRDTAMAESNMMVDRDEDYNTRYGGYKGCLIAFERTKLIPRRPAAIDLTAMVQAAGADTAEKVVDHFASGSCRCRSRTRIAPCSSDFCAASAAHRTTIRPSADAGRLRCASCSIWCSSTPEYQLG